MSPVDGAAQPGLVRQLRMESLPLGLSAGVMGLLLARKVFKTMMAMARTRSDLLSALHHRLWLPLQSTYRPRNAGQPHRRRSNPG